MSVADWFILSVWVAVLTYCFTGWRLLWRNGRRKPEPVADKTEDEELIAIGEAMLAARPRHGSKGVTPPGVRLLCKNWSMDEIIGVLGHRMLVGADEPGGKCKYHYIVLVNDDGTMAGLRLEVHPLRRVK